MENLKLCFFQLSVVFGKASKNSMFVSRNMFGSKGVSS